MPAKKLKSFRLSPMDEAALRRLAKRLGVSQTQALRMSVGLANRHLDRDGSPFDMLVIYPEDPSAG